MIGDGSPGSIVDIGSVLGDGGGGRLKVPGYAAAKGGVRNLTRELASQWARKKVSWSTPSPPAGSKTEMNADMFGTDDDMALHR